MAGFLKVELLHSGIARTQRQKDTLRGLGLRRRHQQRVLQDTPAVRGMIHKVFDLVRFESVASAKVAKPEKLVTYKLGPKPDPAKAKTPSKTQVRKAAALAKAAAAAASEGEAKAGAKKPAGKAKESKAAAKKSAPKKAKG